MSLTTLCSPNKSTYYSPITYGVICPAPGSENMNTFMTDFYNEIIDSIYPVGAHYISADTSNPSALFGRGTWEKVEEGKTLLGTGSNWIDISKWKTKTLQDGTKWARILFQSVTNGGIFNSTTAANSDNENAWSKMDQIANFYSEAGELELLLEYTGLNQKARWRQIDNPSLAQYSSNSNYGPSTTFTDPINSSNANIETGLYVPSSWTSNSNFRDRFSGLARSTSSSTYMDGQTTSDWYFAVGTYGWWNNGIPAISSAGSSEPQSCSLWVRYDNAAGYLFQLGQTGGSSTVSLNKSGWLPSHSHGMAAITRSNGTGADDVGRGSSVASQVTGYTGAGEAHNNMQPYINIHVWKRTA